MVEGGGGRGRFTLLFEVFEICKLIKKRCPLRENFIYLVLATALHNAG